MKTLTIGEIFTADQLKKAAEIMHKNPIPNAALVEMLELDKARFDKLEVDLRYAGYMLEAHKNMILHCYL